MRSATSALAREFPLSESPSFFLGIIVAAAITSLLGLPMGVDAVVEYVAGFALGLFIFQAVFMKDLLGGGYWQAVKGTLLPEWLSMNTVMAGMIPVMAILMTRDMRAMEPTPLRFWGIMSLASLVGAALAYPVNWWLVENGLKHGMRTERALGKGGMKVAVERARLSTAAVRLPTGDVLAHNASEMMTGGVSAAAKFLVTLITIAMLAGGVTLAALYGDLSMRAGEIHEMPMSMPTPN